MVSIRKKLIKENFYYYLEYSYRKNGKVEKKELYLGKKIPKDIDKIKKGFLFSIYNENWLRQFDKIKEN